MSKLDLSKLGYSDLWIKYGFLDVDTFNKQLNDFDKAEFLNTEHYRYSSFKNWLMSKERITQEEVDQYLELAKLDEDPIMAGSALSDLFSSEKISLNQFKYIKEKLPSYGDWTTKLIIRETLKRRLTNEDLTEDLYQDCLAYKKKYKDNRLMIQIINTTDSEEILEQFKTNGSGKQLRTLADKKLKRLKLK